MLTRSGVEQDIEREEISNPLLAELSTEKHPEPFNLIIFGAHGDLTKRKLIPAIYALFSQNRLPDMFSVLGTSRSDLSDEQFRELLKDTTRRYLEDASFDEELWESFASHLYFSSADAKDADQYRNLRQVLERLAESKPVGGNNIFYLSTAPTLYKTIIENLAASGLVYKSTPEKGNWPRVVVEKPFGHDLKSSLDLDAKIHEVLTESQVYRIDHYLGKETVQNIMCFRFANSIFEPLWSRDFVDHVQITNAETIGIEGRGGYYDDAGALRDMIQNHLMQLVALVAMEPPISLDAESTRDERTKVLKAIRPFKAESAYIDAHAVRGQYSGGYVLGKKECPYREEDGVASDSNTETFAALKLYIDNWRWADVPFYVRTGKRMPKRVTEIAIQFRQPPRRLFHEFGGELFRKAWNLESPNVLVLRIQPEQGISLKFATKEPGPTTRIRWMAMDFNYGAAFGDKSPSAYERLLLDCMQGDPSLFARSDFVEASWRLLQPVIDHWQRKAPENCNAYRLDRDRKNQSPELDKFKASFGEQHSCFPNYDSGSWGPIESHSLIASTGSHWREP